MFELVAPTPWAGRPNSASGGPGSPNGAFLGKLNRTKVEECPQFSRGGSGQIRSKISPKCLRGGPRARGASAGMGPWLSELKLCREIRTDLGR